MSGSKRPSEMTNEELQKEIQRMQDLVEKLNINVIRKRKDTTLYNYGKYYCASNRWGETAIVIYTYGQSALSWLKAYIEERDYPAEDVHVIPVDIQYFENLSESILDKCFARNDWSPIIKGHALR